MPLARSFHLVHVALVPTVLLAACQAPPLTPPNPLIAPAAQPGGGPAGPGGPGMAASPPPGSMPGTVAGRSDVIVQVVLPAGSYLKLRSMGVQNVTEVSDSDLRKLRFAINGQILTADQVEMLGSSWDEQGRLILKVRLRGPMGPGPLTLGVSNASGTVALLADASPDQQGDVTLSVDSTARSLVQAILRRQRENQAVPPAIYQLVADRLASLIMSSQTTGVLDAPQLQGLLDALAGFVERQQDLQDPSVLTQLTAIIGKSSTATALILHSPDFEGPLLTNQVLGTNVRIPGGGLSPRFSWSSGPAPKSFVLIMEDQTQLQMHWVVYDIPAGIRQLDLGASTHLPSGAKMGLAGQDAGAYKGLPQYAAPAPLPGMNHVYRATLYALSVPSLAVPENPDVMAVQAAMAGRVIGSIGVQSVYGTDVVSAGSGGIAAE
jgi:phosphatidylethanolamine-binding protein (PEBP) family uncharacterized protein